MIWRGLCAGGIMLAFCFTEHHEPADHRFDGTLAAPAGYHSCWIISMSYALQIWQTCVFWVQMERILLWLIFAIKLCVTMCLNLCFWWIWMLTNRPVSFSLFPLFRANAFMSKTFFPISTNPMAILKRDRRRRRTQRIAPNWSSTNVNHLAPCRQISNVFVKGFLVHYNKDLHILKIQRNPMMTSDTAQEIWKVFQRLICLMMLLSSMSTTQKRTGRWSNLYVQMKTHR